MEAKRRHFEGVVISAKMQKTVVVRVNRMSWHPKYKKQYKISKKFKVHDEKGEARVGEKVAFEETRPMSRDKRWQLTQIIKAQKQ